MTTANTIGNNPRLEQLAQASDRVLFRELLLLYAKYGLGWLETNAGQEFLWLVRKYFAKALVRKAASWGYSLDPDEAVNLILVNLYTLHQEKISKGYKDTPVTLAAAAADTRQYLWACFSSWLRQEYGIRCDSIDNTNSNGYSSGNPWQQETENSDSRLTPIAVVIELAAEILCKKVPAEYRQIVLEVVKTAAHSPPTRHSYEHHDTEEIATLFPDLSLAQVKAITRICWGTRPKTKETSLFAALLTNQHFNPCNSSEIMHQLYIFQKIFTKEHSRQTWRKKLTLNPSQKQTHAKNNSGKALQAG